MRVLLIGRGGRENALAWKLSQSSRLEKLFVAPGNPGTAEFGENISLIESEPQALLDFARQREIDLTVVGPEAPLAAGIVDLFQEQNLKIFGPQQRAARLESSKTFAKQLMQKYDIPTAGYQSFTDPEKALDYIKDRGAPLVVKADGLAAGKGVTVAETTAEAVAAVEKIMIEEKFGRAGEKIVVEEYLSGQEATILAFCDGRSIKPMLPSRDHKPVYDGGKGPNTGGMGAYAPAPLVGEDLQQKIENTIISPTLKALQAEGIDFKGIIYFGLMITGDQAKVLEYNVRFGDPEAQVVLPLLETDLIDIFEAVLEEKLSGEEISWSSNKAVCVIMASGGYPGEYKTGYPITGLEKLTQQQDTIIFQAGTEEREGEIFTAGGRVLGVTALGDRFQETRDRAYSAVAGINFQGSHHRTDIAERPGKDI